MSENESKVIVFSTPYCGICHSLMDWMDKSNIKYEERNLEDTKIREEAEKLTGQEIIGAPVTIINDESILGFNRKAILKALGR